MTRSPLALAALASAAVPGLDPATVEGVRTRPGQLFDVAFIQDSEHRRWVVRAPVTAAAGAQMDVTVALMGLLARRLPFSVPAPRGFAALKEGGRAAVYSYLPGRPLQLGEIPAGSGLAAEIGRAIAALHNIDLALFEEAGMPSYDADTYRSRRLTELDRAAGTGHVPAGLLARWEHQLEDVSLWRFAPTPTHGQLTGEHVLATFEDEQDAATGRIRAFTGWEHAKVADPADDFAALTRQLTPEALDTVLEAYAHARVDRPDAFLEKRARLAGELHLVASLVAAVAYGDERRIGSRVAALRRLDEHTASQESEPPDDHAPGGSMSSPASFSFGRPAGPAEPDLVAERPPTPEREPAPEPARDGTSAAPTAGAPETDDHATPDPTTRDLDPEPATETVSAAPTADAPEPATDDRAAPDPEDAVEHLAAQEHTDAVPEPAPSAEAPSGDAEDRR